jgi:hypothetical protein
MSCFWQAIAAALTTSELQIIKCRDKRDLKKIICSLKKNNKPTPNVLWQNHKLSEKNMKENMMHIKNYDPSQISMGYLTSSADPFLILLAEIFHWKIQFNYCNNLIIIENLDTNPVRVVRFSATSSHIVFVS